MPYTRCLIRCIQYLPKFRVSSPPAVHRIPSLLNERSPLYSLLYVPLVALSFLGLTTVSYSTGLARVNGPIRARYHALKALPPVTSKKSLYRNLLHIISVGKRFPALLDYHDTHSPFRSVKSYNLLIAYSIRCSLFASVDWLFRSMRADGLVPNLETRKLVTRSMVSTGKWQYSWSRIMSSRTTFTRDGGVRLRNVPWQIWLEFLRATNPAVHRNAREHEPIPPFMTSQRDSFVMPPDALSTGRPPPSPVPTRLAKLLAARVLSGQSGIPLRAAFGVVQSLMRMRLRTKAIALAMRYLAGLPRTLSPKCARASMDLVHVILALSPGRGLRRMQEDRRTLLSFLAIHPFLRPTSTTLFVLLGSLRYAKHRGSHAWEVMDSFRRRWGPQIVDKRVIRRVASFAVAEGRRDIADRMLLLGDTQRHPNRPRKIADVPPKLRQPYTASVSRERTYWIRLKGRAARRRDLGS